MKLKALKAGALIGVGAGAALFDAACTGLDQRVGWSVLPTVGGLVELVGIRNTLRAKNSDRFFTSDFTDETYSKAGMDWIRDNTISSVLMARAGTEPAWSATRLCTMECRRLNVSARITSRLYVHH